MSNSSAIWGVDLDRCSWEVTQIRSLIAESDGDHVRAQALGTRSQARRECAECALDPRPLLGGEAAFGRAVVASGLYLDGHPMTASSGQNIDFAKAGPEVPGDDP